MPSAPGTRFSVLASALADRRAAGFVSIAPHTDASHRYLTRYRAPPGTRSAFVFVDDQPILCAPAGDAPRARREFPGGTVVDAASQTGASMGERAAETLQAHDAEGTVLVPPEIPHDAVAYLQRAGFEVSATDAVPQARVVKTPAEVDCIEAAQDAAVDAMSVAAGTLSAATFEERRLVVDGDPLTTDRLRNTVNAALAEEGYDGSTTTVAAGAGNSNPWTRRDHPIHRGRPVVVAIRPRGPHGYHGFLARTFVPDSDGGWDRRADLAATGARDAGLDELADQSALDVVATEVAAEVAAYGFDHDDGGFAAVSGEGQHLSAVHGVGLDPVERPLAGGEERPAPGTVLAVNGRVSDPDEGCVWVGDLAVVTETGVRRLGSVPDSILPAQSLADAQSP